MTYCAQKRSGHWDFAPHIRHRRKEPPLSAPTAGKLRGPYAKTAEKRSTILEAALEVFAESGFRSGSLRDVAARVGMSEAGVLHHFPSKSALLTAVLERRDDHFRERFPLTSPDGETVLRSLVDVVHYNMTTPGIVELFSILAAESTTEDHPAHEYFAARYVEIVEIVETALHEVDAAGGVRPGVDIPAAARQIVAIMDGLQIQWLYSRDSVAMDEVLRQALGGILSFPV